MQSRAMITTMAAVVADDEQLARDELTFLLKDFPEVEVVAVASNGLQALDLIKEPADTRSLNHDQLKQLAEELRRETIDAVSRTGGQRIGHAQRTAGDHKRRLGGKQAGVRG